MPTKPEDEESKIINQMFDEILKMIREKQIRVESIIQNMTEHESMSQDSFDRSYRLLTEYGKKKRWM